MGGHSKYIQRRAILLVMLARFFPEIVKPVSWTAVLCISFKSLGEIRQVTIFKSSISSMVYNSVKQIWMAHCQHQRTIATRRMPKYHSFGSVVVLVHEWYNLIYYVIFILTGCWRV